MPNNALTRKSFKIELKALLKKYNATIGFGASDGSDWYGIHGEYMYASVNGKDFRLCDGMRITDSELKAR